MPRATSLAAVLRDDLGIEAELHEGAGGIYDVNADGERIFSKHESGRYPEDHEILDALKQRI